MDEDQREELEALCVAYFTQQLKEHPRGMTLDYFERTFPDKMDEPRDWYRSTFKQPSVLAALQAIPNSIRLTSCGHNNYYVSLNTASDKVDQHMVDLVSNQKASTKKKRPVPSGYRSQSQRVFDSFSLNRMSSSSSSSNITNRFRAKFDNQPRQAGYGTASRSSANHESVHYHNRSTLYQSRSTKAAPNDPRATAAESSSIDPWAASKDPRLSSRDRQTTLHEQKAARSTVTSQVRPMSSATLSSATPSKQAHSIQSSRTSTSASTPRPHISTPTIKSSKSTLGDEVNAILDKKKHDLREKLVELLTSKFESLKIFYLASIYKEEYKMELDPTHYGHKTMTDLLRDPYFKDHLKIIQDHPHNLICAIVGGESKENVSSRGGNNGGAIGQKNNAEPLMDRSNNLSESRARYNAIDPFNTRTMLQSLEPLKEIKTPLGSLAIEDIIKYRTMRVIFTSPDMTLKLEDWECKYQLEWNSRIKIRIQDYGCKNLLAFFQAMTQDIPIRIRLVDDEWVATTSLEETSKWLNTTLEAGKYRAIIVKHKIYDQVAYPGETYPVYDLKSLNTQDFFPVTIMSVNYPHKMWLQVRTRESMMALMTIETSMTSYADYKKRCSFPVPSQFIKVGFPCVIYDNSIQRYCRAAITEFSGRNEDSVITVFLIDYGVLSKAKKSELQCILRSHLVQPVSLIYAQLHGVAKDFEKMAKMTLQEFTNPPVVLACKIISSIHTPGDDVDIRWQSRKSISDVTLIDTRQGRDCDLATAINNCNSTAEDVD